ncbi:MAG: DHH family phosphoesterase [Asgard group archaeon]|nr:DHH family phosphoesterase [Asgard group archaeon]
MPPIDIPFEKYQSLKDKAKEIADIIKNLNRNIVVIARGTPDDLCATGILLKCLRNLDVGAHSLFMNEVTDLEKKIKNFDYSAYFFIGYNIEDIPDLVFKEEKNIIVVVNQELIFSKEMERRKEDVTYLNLEDSEIPLGSVSNAGLVYFVSANIDDDYPKYAELAIIGGLSKKQVNPKNQELIGLNKIILEEGREKQYLDISKGTRIAGRESQPLHLALKYSINPYFPGLTGNESACTSFVSRLGIPMRDQEDNWRTIASLSSKETKKLNDGLISLLMENNNHPLSDIHKLIGPIYTLTQEIKKNQTRNAEEFLWLLEGACNLKSYGLALGVVLGDRTKLYDKLIRKLSDYHGKATKAIEIIAKEPEKIEERKNYRFLDGTNVFENTTAKQIIDALVESGIIQIDKPIIVHLKVGEKIHLHVRESPINIQKGHLIYHAFEKLKEENVLLDHRGELETFEVVLNEDKLSPVFESIVKSLEYYEKGEAKDTEEEDEKSKEKEKAK